MNYNDILLELKLLGFHFVSTINREGHEIQIYESNYAWTYIYVFSKRCKIIIYSDKKFFLGIATLLSFKNTNLFKFKMEYEKVYK